MELSGKVIAVKNGFGFIQPNIELPDKYTKQQIYFRFNNVVDNVTVSMHDQVIFEINDTCSPDKPSAKRVVIPNPLSKTVPNSESATGITGVQFSGVLVRVFEAKGFGFIQPEVPLPPPYSNRQLFCHFSNIKSKSKPSQNDKVKFEINERDKPEKLSAINVVLVDPQIPELSQEEIANNILDVQFSGTVISLKNQFGFIEPAILLPEPYTRGRVHFTFRCVRNRVTLSENDKVLFVLNEESDPGRPSAKLVISLSDDSNIQKEKAGDNSSSSNDRKGKNSNGTGNASVDSNGNKANLKRSTVIKDMYAGEIVTILKETPNKPAIGYIKPDELLPIPYPLDKDVFFRLESVQTAGYVLKEGDKVEFSLGTKNKSKPIGFRVRLTECGKWSLESIEKFIQQCVDKISGEHEARSEDLLGLTSCDAVWKSIGDSKDWVTNSIKLLMEFIEKLEKTCRGLEENFKNMLEMLTATQLFNPWKGSFRTFVESTINSIDFIDGILQLQSFLLLIMRYVPQKTRAIVGIIKPVVTRNSNETFLYGVLKQLCKSSTETCIDDMEWDELPLVPSVKEMLYESARTSTTMQPVKQKGRYSSVEEYIDTYFRLLRADCFNALTTGIKSLLSGSLDPRDMFVYQNIKLSGVVITQNENGLSLGLKVNPQVEVHNWEIAPNLIFGNLLCISPNGNFRDVIWATVINRSLLKSHEIVLLDLCTECNGMSDSEAVRMIEASGGQGLMVESPTYYRAYQPVLKALQQIEPDKLAFQKELVEVSKSSPPRYIGEDTIIQESIITTNLDESQQKAVKQALDHRVAIIQGPPGTGKTYVGLKLIALLNSIKPAVKLPILVLTYKNHVLDEFLMGLLKMYPEGVARVGGRSQEPGLQGCNLNQLKKEKLTGMAQGMQNDIQQYKAKIEELKPKVEKSFKRLEKDKVLTMEVLRKNLSTEQIQELLEGCNWAEANIPTLLNRNAEEGFKGAKKKKKKPNVSSRIMYQEEAMNILGILGTDAAEFLAKEKEDEIWVHVNEMVIAAIKQWIPPKSEFDDLVQDLYSHVKLSTKVEKQKKSSKKAEVDTLELEEERLTAYATDFESKEDILKNIIMLDSDKVQKEWMPILISSAKSILEELPLGYLTRENLWQLAENERVIYIQAILHNMFEENGKVLEDNLREYQRLCRAKNEIENKHKVDLLKTKKVVGMTITGASIHHDMLAQLRPQIVIVEEAAEVLEPQLLAATGDWCEQLIMIGDHKQLRPPVESITLVRDYYLDVSMMERLINNKLDYATLTMQNRMRPEFAEMMVDIYPQLESNFARVIKNAQPACIANSMFFWDHSKPEKVHHHTYTNEEEADRAIQLALFLIQQGYEPQKITILGSYLRQVRLLRVKMIAAQKNHPEIMDMHKKDSKLSEEEARKPNRVKIQTIDNYQGDENEIVIISLVRSNDKKKIGFLKHQNRRCVAQSRARCGMYFIGNKDTLNGSTWGPVIDHMKDHGLLGEKLRLQCPRHDTYSRFEAASACDITLGSFCDMHCSKLMDCKRHLCKRKCQPNHRHLQCKESVSFAFKGCEHHGTRKCSQEESDVLCNQSVQHKFTMCSHTTMKPCYQKVEEVKCKEECGRLLPCNHSCRALCSDPCSSDTCKICAMLRKMEEDKRRREEDANRKKIKEETSAEIEKMKKSPIDEQVIRYELKPSGDTASEYFDIEDMVKKYVMADHKWFPIVKKIEKVSNGKLKLRWLAKKESMFDPSYTPLKFHGTDAKAVDSILKTGFLMPTPNNQMYGPGIYFATDSSKSAQKMYTKGSNMLMLCRVLLGKTYTVERARPDMTGKKLKDNGYDSLYAKRGTKKSGGVLFDEYVVYHPHGALPEYIIHYEKSDVVQVQTAVQSLEQKALLDQKIIKYTATPKREIKMNDPLDVHFRIAEAQFLRLSRAIKFSQSTKAVTAVEYWINPVLLRAFNKKCDEFKKKYTGKEKDYILAFHGTKPQYINGILEKNFDLSKLSLNSGDSGWYGAGIYFSEFPDVSLAYGESLLLCKVLPGKSYDVPGRMDGAKLQNGYDSHRFNADSSGHGEELVIFGADQILPCYVVKL